MVRRTAGETCNYHYYKVVHEVHVKTYKHRLRKMWLKHDKEKRLQTPPIRYELQKCIIRPITVTEILHRASEQKI